MLSAERLRQLTHLETKLGILFHDKELLDLALTHSSWNFEHPEGKGDNERLEFFGDAVMKLVISEYLMNRFPNANEGDLTKIRAVVVSDSMLAKKAKDIALGDYLLLSTHERRSGGDQRDSNLANAMEAIFAAAYLDQKNLKTVYEFLTVLFGDIMESAISPESIIDAKSALQEYAQKNGADLPLYEVSSEYGPDHNKTFEIKAILTIRDQVFEGVAHGKTKKEAEQAAARKVLDTIVT